MKTSLLQGATKEPVSAENLNFHNAYLSVAIVMSWSVLFWQTIVETVTVWSTSETFAHGFMVLPIVIWLLWRDKKQFLALKINVSLGGAMLGLLFILLWLIGQALEISVIRQLGFFGGIAASHWMVFGCEFAKRYQFPLCYLIFAVPMGNTLIPFLQQITAEITVFMLKLSNIPVFFEGLYITIPSGNFEVAVACSGIRYLIASMAVGTLYAYLNYHKFYKQVIFVVLSFIIPILANGLRAYLIVIIAHLSNLKYATGVDHLIYGWIFFGLVISLMFYLGGFFADRKQNIKDDIMRSSATKFNLIPIVIVTAVAISAVAINRNIESVAPPSSPQLLTLAELSDFTTLSSSPWGVNFSYALALFSGIDAKNIELYVAKFANRQTRGELVTSTNWYYDKKYWSETDRTQGSLMVPHGNIEYIELRLVNSYGHTRLMRYWYVINGQHIVNLVSVKLNQALLALQNSKKPVFFIGVSTSYESNSSAFHQAQINLNQFMVEHPVMLETEN